MPKFLVVRDEVYEYPVEGENNYGEEATAWAADITDVVSEIAGPGDIATTEVSLVGTLNPQGFYEGNISGFSFDTTYVQSIEATGHITRTYTDSTAKKVEYFNLVGAYNDTEINFCVDFSGDDTDFEFSVVGGQFRFKYLRDADQDTIIIKFSAKAKVDSGAFSG